MNDARFEAWLEKVAATPEVHDAMARAKAKPPLPAEVLADYYAGLLSPKEAQLVQRRIALSESASAFLARLDADVHGAAVDVSPRFPALVVLRARIARLEHAVAQSLGRLATPARAWRLAAGAAAAVVLVVASTRLLDRPPGDFGAPFDPTVVRRGPSTYELPDGTLLNGWDPDWQLRTPERHPAHVRWFSWDPVPGAATYQLELRDAAGKILFTRSGIKHQYMRLPWSIRRQLEKGTIYVWVVTAVGNDQAPLVRAVGRFQLD